MKNTVGIQSGNGAIAYGSQEELVNNYFDLMDKLEKLIHDGLTSAVYTQTTDVEGEVNGLLTYDREVIKIPAEKLAERHKKFYGIPK